MTQPISGDAVGKTSATDDSWDIRFIVEGATVSVSLDAPTLGDSQRSRLELAKRAIERLAAQQRSANGRNAPPTARTLPNTFDCWAYRTD